MYLVLQTYTKLELMFMKHYAPNRCLYIKVAKLRVGSAEMSHLQNCSLRGGGGVRMDVNEELKFNYFFLGGGGRVGGVEWGGGVR